VYILPTCDRFCFDGFCSAVRK